MYSRDRPTSDECRAGSQWEDDVNYCRTVNAETRLTARKFSEQIYYHNTIDTIRLTIHVAAEAMSCVHLADEYCIIYMAISRCIYESEAAANGRSTLHVNAHSVELVNWRQCSIAPCIHCRQRRGALSGCLSELICRTNIVIAIHHH